MKIKRLVLEFDKRFSWYKFASKLSLNTNLDQILILIHPIHGLLSMFYLIQKLKVPLTQLKCSKNNFISFHFFLSKSKYIPTLENTDRN